MKPIPIKAAERIAKYYDYDQVIIIARKVGDGGGEHVTTFGRNPDNCRVAAHLGNFIKTKIMNWAPDLMMEQGAALQRLLASFRGVEDAAREQLSFAASAEDRPELYDAEVSVSADDLRTILDLFLGGRNGS